MISQNDLRELTKIKTSFPTLSFYALTDEKIAKKIEQIFGITLRQLREKSKDRETMTGRKLMSFVAKEYGYKGKEIAKYMRKDPVVVTRYLKERNNFSEEVEKICSSLRKN